MIKRILALCLCAVLLMTALPMKTQAATEEEIEQICNRITSFYFRTLSAMGLTWLEGWCGAMAGWELYFLGVADSAITQNGNEMYDIFADGKNVAEGIRPAYYPDTEYSLGEALNTITACGTKDAYNLMVCFHRTNTYEGRKYGHVMVIHAILDGVVYFTEGFVTPYGKDPAKAMICTIEEFTAYYNSWADFEGIVHFEAENTFSDYLFYPCDLYITTAPGAVLWVNTEQEAKVYRTVQNAERLHATGLYEVAEGRHLYRIEENGQIYYTEGTGTNPVWISAPAPRCADLGAEAPQKAGQAIALSGTVYADRLRVYNVTVEITDEAGTQKVFAQQKKDSNMLDLSNKTLKNQLSTKDWASGIYTCQVSCDVVNYYCQDGLVCADIQQIPLMSKQIAIGEAVLEETPAAELSEETVTPRQLTEGWNLTEGAWYYVENGTYRTGWICENGVDYYLLPDGNAAVGWQEINGKMRYFTETGAMRIGWIKLPEGVYYAKSNGELAIGGRWIDGLRYTFDETGRLMEKFSHPVP